jgi:hypothetical protein
MKKFKAWEKSKLNLNEYLIEPCQIDEELYLSIGSIVVPKCNLNGFIQCGEAEYEKDDMFYYMTVSIVNGKYYYLGILPEFYVF